MGISEYGPGILLNILKCAGLALLPSQRTHTQVSQLKVSIEILEKCCTEHREGQGTGNWENTII